MTDDGKPTPEEIEREIAKVVGELHTAADALSDKGFDRPADAIRVIARVGEDGDLHECSAEFAIELEGMESSERVLALGGIYDVAKLVGTLDKKRGTAAAMLTDLLLECETLYPDEMAEAIGTKVRRTPPDAWH